MGEKQYHGRYFRRCPFCRGGNTRWESGALECADCTGRVPARRESLPAWETDPRLSGDWDAYSRPGRLDAWLDARDRALDADARENLARIQQLAAAVRALRAHVQRRNTLAAAGGARRRPRPTLPRRLMPWVRWCGVVWDAVLAWTGLELENARLRRGGLHEDIVTPSVARTTPFAGYRHAIAVAFGGEGLGEIGAGGLTLGGAESLFSLPRGVVLGSMAVAPTRTSSGSARGVDRIVASVDVWNAITAARVDRRVDTSGRVIDRGRGLATAELRLLELVDYGATRARAFRQNRSVVPAVEPLTVRDALERLRRRDGAALPTTEHEAKLLIGRARRAILEVLVERGLVPPRRREAIAREVSPPPPPATPGPVEFVRLPPLGVA